MAFKFWWYLNYGTQNSDTGVFPPSTPTPATNKDLFRVQVQYNYLFNGDDDFLINLPWRAVTSLGNGNDRFTDTTNWALYASLDVSNFRGTISQVYGDAGDDTLIGGSAPDVLKGGPGSNQLLGGDNDDVLLGNGGSFDGVLANALRLYYSNSHVKGGPFLNEHPSLNFQASIGDGQNYLNGGDGNDFLAGASQQDSYQLGTGADWLGLDGISAKPVNDIAFDFNPAEDRITYFTPRFAGFSFSGNIQSDFEQFVRTEQVGADTQISYNRTGDPATGSFEPSVLLQNVNAADVTIANFPEFIPDTVFTIAALRASFSSTWDDYYVIDDSYSDKYPIYAGSGNDYFGFAYSVPPSHAVPIDGGIGDDTLWGSQVDDLLRGGPGNNDVRGYEGDDVLIGGNGGATKFFGSLEQFQLPVGYNYLDGGPGSDVLHNDSGAATMTGGTESDTFIVHVSPLGPLFDSTVITDFRPKAASDADYLIIPALHSPGAQVSISVDSAANATRVIVDPDGAGAATPTIAVTLENLLVGGVDDLNIVGLGTGVTEIAGLHASYGTFGNDNVAAPSQWYTSYLLSGDDVLDGSAATYAFTAYACHGSDSLVGGAFGDLLVGGSGADTLRGENGDDVLIGDGEDGPLDPLNPYAPTATQPGADLLVGGAGDDLIVPGEGPDTIDGGAGVDSTLFDGRTSIGDLFIGFDTGFFGDRIMFANVFSLDSGQTAPSAYISAVQVGSDTHLMGDFDAFGFGDSTLELLAILQGVNAGSVLINTQLIIADPFHANNAPVADDGAASTPVNTPLFGALPAAFDADGDRVTYSLAAAPLDGQSYVSPNGVFAYLPDTGFTGPDSFDFTVSDGKGGENTYTALLDVFQPNRAPTSANAVLAATEDVPLAGNLPAANDPDGDPVTYTLAAAALNGTATVAPGGAFTYNPSPNYHGTDLFKFKVADGKGGENVYDAALIVAEVNDPPTAANNAINATEDLLFSATLPAGFDIDGDPFTYSLAMQATHGTASVDPGGAFTYRGAQDYNGPDSFDYTIADNRGGMNTYTTTVTVAPVNDAPVASDTVVGAVEDTQFASTLPAGFDVEGDPFGYSLSMQATHGTASVNLNGSFTYDPAPNFFGGDSFRYAITDNLGASSEHTVTVDVAGVVDTIIGSEGPDELFDATGGPSLIDGRGGNDSIIGAEGDDTILGGTGEDTSMHNGPISGHTLHKNPAGASPLVKGFDSGGASTGGPVSKDAVEPGDYTVDDTSGDGGTDSLNGVEHVMFADMTVNLMVQALAASAPRADVVRLIELYVAFFNRVSDADGMFYWIGQKLGGQSIVEIAESFYNAGIQYPNLTGFSASMTNEDFINVVYRNVLGRSEGADPGGLAYWGGELASGRESRGSLVSTILDSAHTFKGDATYGWVADLLDNKIEVSETFAIDWGLNYNTPEESIEQGMAIAAAITPTDTSAAIALIGVQPGQIELG